MTLAKSNRSQTRAEGDYRGAITGLHATAHAPMAKQMAKHRPKQD
jgi:hypothetical protein